MFCSKCGKELTGKERFCPRCGNALETPVVKQTKDSLMRTSGKNTERIEGKSAKSRKKKCVIIAMCAIAVILAVGAISYFLLFDSDYEYLARVQNSEGKFGFIDERGREVIPCKYDLVTGWIDGAAVIWEKVGEDRNGDVQYKYGLINDKGKTIVTPQYDDFAVGFEFIAMAVHTGEFDEEGEPVLNWGFLSADGEALTEFKYQYENRPNLFGKNGIAAVSQRTGEINENGEAEYKYGVINKEGEEIIPIEYPVINDFDTEFGNLGLISVGKMIGVEMQYGYINYKNERVIPFKYDSAVNFSENGLARVNQEGKYGYIDEKGNEVISVQYEDASLFGENGLAFVENSTGEVECINEHGETVFSCDIYQEYGKVRVSGSYFDEDGLAEILIDTTRETVIWGVINEKGDIVITPGKYSIRRWHSYTPYTLTEDDKSFQFADLNGDLLDVRYDYAGNFSENGFCCVGIKEGTNADGENIYRYSYIDKKGKTVLEPSEEYIYVADFSPVNQRY